MKRTFEIGGLSYDLLDIDDFDFDQGAELRDLTNGMGLFEAQEKFNDGDMVVWRGLLLMSIHVKNPTFTMADLGRLKIMPVLVSYMESVKKEAAKSSPPAEAPLPRAARRSSKTRASARASSPPAATPDAPGAPA